MIPSIEYIFVGGVGNCVTGELIKEYHSPEECKRFAEWFNGQTGIVLDDGVLGIYASDYERWTRQGMRDRQCSHDWD